MKRPRLVQVNGNGDDSTVRSECERAMALGFDGVELVAHANTVTSLPDSATCHAGAVAIQCTACDPIAAVREVVPWLELTGGWDVSCLNLRIPPVSNDSGQASFARCPDALNFAHELIRAVRYDAERTGVCLAIEAASGGCFMSAAELRELIDEAHCWAIGACLDLDRIDAIGSPDDWLATLGRRVRAVRRRSKSANRTTAEDVLAETLDAIRFEGPLILREQDQTEVPES